MIEEKYMREFAYLKDVAYLDVASVGLQPERTLQHCRRFQQDFVDSFGRICFGTYGKMRAAVAANLARLIGADLPKREEDEEILFTTNTTEGNSLLAGCLPLRPGDSVITGSGEYPSVSLGWVMKQKDGIRLRLVPSMNGILDADEIIGCMDESTRVVEISFVQYMSGFKADLRRIGMECRRRNILFSVDAIQGLGRNPLNVKEMCIDVLSCGAFKGLFGPFGTGFTYVRKEVVPLLTPRWHGENNLKVEEEEPFCIPYRSVALGQPPVYPFYPYRQGIRRLAGGSMNTYGITAMGKNVELLLEIGIDRIHDHVMGLERYFRDRAAEEALPLTFAGSANQEHWSGNICMHYAPDQTEKLVKALEKRRIYARISDGFLRLGLHYYNTREHMDLALDALREAVGQS